jgi:hypothetical protein
MLRGRKLRNLTEVAIVFVEWLGVAQTRPWQAQDTFYRRRYVLTLPL